MKGRSSCTSFEQPLDSLYCQFSSCKIMYFKLAYKMYWATLKILKKQLITMQTVGSYWIKHGLFYANNSSKSIKSWGDFIKLVEAQNGCPFWYHIYNHEVYRVYIYLCMLRIIRLRVLNYCGIVSQEIALVSLVL